MLPLVHPQRWKIAGILLLVAVLGMAIAPAIFPWTSSNDPRWLLISDKWLHGITFAFLAVWYSGQLTKRAYWWLAIGLVGFGALIEVCQSMISYRTAEAGDLVADIIGIVVGLTIAMIGAGGWSLRAEAWLQSYFD